jgi:hypothetical protein
VLLGAELEVVGGDESSSSFHLKATQAAVYRIGPITTQRECTTFGSEVNSVHLKVPHMAGGSSKGEFQLKVPSPCGNTNPIVFVDA